MRNSFNGDGDDDDDDDDDDGDDGDDDMSSSLKLLKHVLELGGVVRHR